MWNTLYLLKYIVYVLDPRFYLSKIRDLALGIKSRGNLWQIAINIPQTDHCCCGILILTDRTIYTTFSAWEMVCSWQIRSNQYVLRFLERNYTYLCLPPNVIRSHQALPLPQIQIYKVVIDDVQTSNNLTEVTFGFWWDFLLLSFNMLRI